MLDYKVLKKNRYYLSEFSLLPIRFDDRFQIMKWRNEQMYHLRQNKLLTEKEQEGYFLDVVCKLYDQEKPDQLLFSFFEGSHFIGYGGLVHINWNDANAEISFIMDTVLESTRFEELWITYLSIIEEIAFEEIGLHKIYTYAFDLRPKLYLALTQAGFFEEARLREHAVFKNSMIDVIIHSKINNRLVLKSADIEDVEITYKWAIDDLVRQHSFNKNKITFEHHESWFRQKIDSSECMYFILLKGAIKIGSVRIDLTNDLKEGVISYLVGSEFHGMGFGKKILQLVEAKFIGKEISLKGIVLNVNVPSIRIFEKLGYEKISDVEGVSTFIKKINK
jgi:RimJ/RimL family protein N-acetyltransferase